MKFICNHCGKAVRGRTDKKFCQLSCKNSYHNSTRKKDSKALEKNPSHLDMENGLLGNKPEFRLLL
jgi:hypothetical protein